MLSEIKQKFNFIDTLESDVRKYINTTRYQNNLIKDGNNWDQICCSLDTINDTAYVMNDYIDSEYPKKAGLRYLFTYGLLQALFIQQDAVSHLSEAFGIAYNHSDRLKEIRLLRNAAIGHPTKQKHTKSGHIYYNYISRTSLDKQGFTLMRSYKEGKTEFLDIKLFPIINDQLDEIKSAYEVIANTLKETDRMHKEKHKDTRLVDIFHSSMGYVFEKVAQGIHSPEPNNRNSGLNMLKIIQETYKEFEDALKNRGDLSQYTKHDLTEYNHSLSKLESYLTGDDTNMTDRDARIYYYYAREQHKHFEEIAEEIDNSYNGDNEA